MGLTDLDGSKVYQSMRVIGHVDKTNTQIVLATTVHIISHMKIGGKVRVYHASSMTNLS